MTVSATNYIEVIKIDQETSDVEASGCGYVVIWTQTNGSRRAVNYRFIVTFDGNTSVGTEASGFLTFDTANEYTVKYFSIDGNVFPMGGLNLSNGQSKLVKFHVPSDIVTASCELITYADNVRSGPVSLDLQSAYYTQKKLLFERDLIKPGVSGCCSTSTIAKTVGYKSKVNVSDYNIYLYDGRLTLIDGNRVINNREVVVFINSGDDIDLNIVLSRLANDPGILPHRQPAIV